VLFRSTCGEYFRVAHWVIVDGALTFFILLSLAAFVAAYHSESSRKRLLFYIVCYVSCVLAFFVKGFIGVIIPGLTILAFLFFRKDFRELLRMRVWVGVCIFLVLVTPWFLELWRLGGGEYLGVFLIHNHLGRFVNGSSGHHRPIYYYLIQFPIGFLPWGLLIPPVFYRAFRKSSGPSGPDRVGILFAKCWFVAGFLFLTLASTKRVLYLMPIFAPAAMMTAWFIDSTLKGLTLKRFEKIFTTLFALALLLAGATAVPVYFFFCRKYDLPPSWLAIVWIIVFSLVAVILSVEAFWRHRRDIGLFWGLSGGAVVSLSLLVLVAVIPLIDSYKSFVPFSADVRALVPASAPLYAYRPDETLRGALPFYTGRYLVELETPEALSRALDREKTLFVVARDKRGQLKAEILEAGSFSLLSRHGIDTGRSLLLFQSGSGKKRQK
jgi:4-amino-4-deoxy-L-arabinose transferase-like glycosyltransferase